MPATPQMIHHESTPLFYEHPYLFTRSKDHATVYAWSNPDSSQQPISLKIEGSGITHIGAKTFAETYILVHESNPNFCNTILLFRSNDGNISDTKTIVSDSNPDDPAHRPIRGDSALLGVTEDLVAIFRNGTGPRDSTIEIYGVSDEGKFVLKNTLRHPSDGHALVEDVENKTWGPSGYTLPTVFYFNEHYFIGGFGQHAVQLVKWSSEPSQPSALEVPGSRSADQISQQSWLNDKLYIPSSNSLILAHHEFPFDFVDYAPITSIRSIDPDTLQLKWCSPVGHKTERLRYNGRLNVLISFGCAGERDPNSNESPPRTGIYILDAETGAVRRQVCTDTRCETSPSGEEFVIVYDDGRVVVVPLSSFIERGFPEESSATDDSPPDPSPHVTFRYPAFYPELEPETPLNSKARTKERKTVEKYAESGQARPWVDDLFVGNGIVLLKGAQKLGYVSIRWK